MTKVGNSSESTSFEGTGTAGKKKCCLVQTSIDTKQEPITKFFQIVIIHVEFAQVYLEIYYSI